MLLSLWRAGYFKIALNQCSEQRSHKRPFKNKVRGSTKNAINFPPPQKRTCLSALAAALRMGAEVFQKKGFKAGTKTEPELSSWEKPQSIEVFPPCPVTYLSSFGGGGGATKKECIDYPLFSLQYIHPAAEQNSMLFLSLQSLPIIFVSDFPLGSVSLTT